MTIAQTAYLTPEQVCEMVPGMTKGNLAQRRFQGLPPQFLKPTPRVVLYRHEDVIEWLEESVQTSTTEREVARDQYKEKTLNAASLATDASRVTESISLAKEKKR